MRKIILSLIGIVIIVASLLVAKKLIDNKKKPKPVAEKVVKTVFTETAKNKTIPVIIPASGTLVAKRRIALFSEVQGVFKGGSKLFKTGQKYTKGQTLIRIDANEYYASVQSAKSNLYNAIAAIMPDLRLDFPKVFPKWQTYLANYDLTKTTPELPEITSEKENYFISGRSIIANYFQVKNLEQRLSKYRLVAPFTGIITEALVIEGSLIRNGQKLGEFIDTSRYEMEVGISASLANFIKTGKKVRLTNLEKTASYEAVITRIGGKVDNNTQSLSVFIEVADKSLKEDIFLEANIEARKEANAIEIDRNLLLGDQQVYIVKDGTLQTIKAAPVYFSDKKVVLKSIPDGTVLLKKPVPGAYVGMIVKPYEAKANVEKNK